MTLEIDGLPPLRQIIQTHGLSAKKHLGQNFLLDFNLVRKIARGAGADKGYDFLEIGAGPAGLSRALLHEGAKSLTIIEKDERCIPILEQLESHYTGKVRWFIADALKTDYANLMKDYPNYAIAANLPYNISSELLTLWLSHPVWIPSWKQATLMFQKEFADRLMATHENDDIKEYGRLSVLAGWRTQVKRLMDVHPSNFTPPPSIMSSVIQVIPQESAFDCDVKMLERVTQATFGQRRKMIRQSLKSVTPTPEAMCGALGLDPTLRADHLSIDDYLRIGCYLQKPRYS